jgi:hypothetical protein
MYHQASERAAWNWRRALRVLIAITAAALITVSLPKTSFANEGCVSFWLPGRFAGLPAICKPIFWRAFGSPRSSWRCMTRFTTCWCHVPPLIGPAITACEAIPATWR